MRRLIFLATITLLAQDSTFKVNTNLVTLNVTVKDKSGNPLTNLKKEDIEVYEDGVKQTVAVFEMQTLSSDLLPPIDIACRRIRENAQNHRGEGHAAARASEAEEANVTSPRPRTRSAIRIAGCWRCSSTCPPCSPSNRSAPWIRLSNF